MCMSFCLVVVYYVYIFIFVGGFPAGWTLGTGSCIYHMELGPGAGRPRAEISRENFQASQEKDDAHMSNEIWARGCLGEICWG